MSSAWLIVIGSCILFHGDMRKYFILITFLLLSVVAFLLYNYFMYIEVIVKFDELEPFDKKMNVYFKGFQIGKTIKIYPDKDFQNTYLKIRLRRREITLPSNSTVKIRKIKSGSYVDILYPDNPSLTDLKNNDVIKGIITKDINSFLEGKFQDENMDDIVDDAASLVENANVAIKSLNDIFVEVKGVIQDIRPDIKLAASNIAIASQNLTEASQTINNAIGSDTAKSSVNNIADTTKNIKDITENINDITKQIDEVILPVTNNVLCQTQGTMSNVNEISNGLKNTLKKRFGFGRVLFGSPVSE